MRGGTDKIIEAGLNTLSIIASFIQALLGLFDLKYLVLYWSLALAIILTLLVKFFLNTTKAIVYFTVVIVITILTNLMIT